MFVTVLNDPGRPMGLILLYRSDAGWHGAGRRCLERNGAAWRGRYSREAEVGIQFPATINHPFQVHGALDSRRCSGAIDEACFKNFAIVS